MPLLLWPSSSRPHRVSRCVCLGFLHRYCSLSISLQPSLMTLFSLPISGFVSFIRCSRIFNSSQWSQTTTPNILSFLSITFSHTAQMSPLAQAWWLHSLPYLLNPPSRRQPLTGWQCSSFCIFICHIKMQQSKWQKFFLPLHKIWDNLLMPLDLDRRDISCFAYWLSDSLRNYSTVSTMMTSLRWEKKQRRMTLHHSPPCKPLIIYVYYHSTAMLRGGRLWFIFKSSLKAVELMECFLCSQYAAASSFPTARGAL